MKDKTRTLPGSIPAVEGGGLCVLINPGSGEGCASERLGEVRAAFSELGVDAEVRLIENDPVEAATRALDEGFGTVAAMGGDGTVSAVAGVLAGTGAQMGVLPAGTFNYFARSLGIPEDLRAAARVIVDGEARQVPVGRAGGRVFLNNASIGAYAAILAHREEVYRSWGRNRTAAYWAAIRALMSWRRPMRITIEVDGESRTLRTPLLFAINNAYQLREMGLEGEDLVADGKLAIFIAPDIGRWGMVYQAIRLALGLSQKNKDFELIGQRELKVKTRRRSTLLAVDGERSRARSPIIFSADAQGVPVLVPRQGSQAAS